MSAFHFLRPWWLLALIPVLLLIRHMQRGQASAGDWREYCDPALLPHILIGQAALRSVSRYPLWLAGMTGLLGVLALAGPAWERLPTPVFRNLSALVVVLDLSSGMDATDVKPNRLERARFKIDDIFRARKDGQTALVAYAGDAFTVTPLTDDVSTITAQLGALSPRMMPIQGSRMDLGLAAAGRLLSQAGQRSGDILLVTTGAGVADAGGTAAQLKAEGYRVSALGIGSRDGAPVPLAEGGFMKDAQGGMLLSRLDVKALWDLTQAGGGLYHTLDQAGADVDAVLTFIDRRAEAGQDSGNAVNVDQWREGGVWLLPLLLPLAALAFRRGWLGLVLLLVLSPLPQPAEALEWQDLWLTPDQQAQRKLAAGDAKAAAEQFQNPDWKAAAEYRAGNFEQSAKALDALPGATAHYNRGNALARQGQLEAAIKAYDQALKQAPQDEDARYNRQLVADALKQQQAQQKQDKDKQDHASDGKDQGDQKPSPQKDRKDGKDDKSDQKNTSPQQQDSNQQDHQGQQDPNQNQQDDGSQSQSQPGSDPSGQQDTKAGEQHQGQKQNPQDGQDQNGPDQPSPDEPQDQAPQDEPQGQASQGQQGQQKPPQQAPVPQPAPEPPAAEPEQNKASPANPATSSERQQAEAQWLRRIPDDPGGLLKRKFYYQYRQRQQQQMERKAW